MIKILLCCLLVLFVVVVSANDPAPTWLAYAKSPGNGGLLTFVNATWMVPNYPSRRFGSSSPGFWFGIEPSPATNLIQPILAYNTIEDAEFYGDYTIFDGYFQWSNFQWSHSATHKVSPGDIINGWVKYDKSSNSYACYITDTNSGWSATMNIKVPSGKVYTDTYFVVEHQPNSCEELPPAKAGMTFYDIEVQIDYKTVTPNFKPYKFKDVCDTTAVIKDPSTIEFTWTNSND